MIQTWEAIRFEKQMESGRTRPMVIECVRQISASVEEGSENQPERRLMIVKALGLPEVTEQSLFCEVFGNLLAREIGINTASPALVSLSQPLVESLNANYNLNLQTGIGVGCEYLRGLTPFSTGTRLTAEEIGQATLIYGFDLLVQNPDRRWQKPNCALQPGKLLAYDFEMCFSFLYDLLEPPPPWQVSQHGMAVGHLFHSFLQSKAPNWRPLIEALQRLTEADIERLTVTLPETWQIWAVKSARHLLEVKANLSEFELELQRSLL